MFKNFTLSAKMYTTLRSLPQEPRKLDQRTLLAIIMRQYASLHLNKVTRTRFGDVALEGFKHAEIYRKNTKAPLAKGLKIKKIA